MHTPRCRPAYLDMAEMPDEEEARWYYQLALQIKELIDKTILKSSGQKGAGAFYILN